MKQKLITLFMVFTIISMLIPKEAGSKSDPVPTLTTLTIYSDGTRSQGAGTAVCSASLITTGQTCTGLLDPGSTYRFEASVVVTTADYKPTQADMLSAVGANQVLGSMAVGVLDTGTFNAADTWTDSITGSTARGSNSGGAPTISSGTTGYVYWIVTIAADAADDTNVSFFVTDGSISDTSETVTITVNDAPTGTFNSAAQKTDGSGTVDISIEVDDDEDDNTSAQIAYDSTGGGACSTFTGDPTLATPLTADTGTPSLSNSDTYQIGTSTPILTSSGSNTVQFDWDSNNVLDLPAGNSTYCLELTVNDGNADQATPDTQTLVIDNVNPATPGNLTDGGKTETQITLTFGAASSDTNFNRYRIFYKVGTSGVTRSDTEWTDPDLLFANYNGTTSTTVTGLASDTDYVFNIWAFDDYCTTSIASCTQNFAGATEVTIKTNAPAATIDISGSCKQEDLTTDCPDSGTLKVAVNTSVQAEEQTTVAGVWTISAVNTPSLGDVITVWIDGAADNAEAVNVSVYDGGGAITGISLVEGALSIGSDDITTVSNTAIGTYDNSVSGDEDIFMDVDAVTNDLTVDITGNIANPRLFVRQKSTYRPDATDSGDVYSDMLSIDSTATFTIGDNMVTLTGTWNNAARGTVNANTSQVVFIGDSDIYPGGEAFYEVTVGNASNGGIITTFGTLDVNGSLNVGNGGATTIDISDDKLIISGTLDLRNLDSFITTASSVVFDGTLEVISNDLTFYDVRIGTNSAGAVVTVSGDMDINGGFSVRNGGTTAIDVSGDALFINGTFDLTNLDTWTVGTTLYFDGDSVLTTAGYSMNDVSIGTSTAGGILTLNDALDVDGRFVVKNFADTTLDMSNETLTASGTFTLTGIDNVISTSSSLVFDGTLAQTVSIRDKTFHVIRVDNTSDTVTFTTPFRARRMNVPGGGQSLLFADNEIFTITGTLVAIGSSTDVITMNSTSGVNRFTFDFTTFSQTVAFVNVSRSESNNNDIRAESSTDGGGNDNFEATPHWIIPVNLFPDTPDGNTGSYTRFPASGEFNTKIGDGSGTIEYLREADDGVTYIASPVQADGTMFVNLTNTPADFGSTSSIYIKARHREGGSGDDTCTVFYQIFQSDGTTAITGETSGTLLGTSYTNNTYLVTDGGEGKTIWDGALLRIRNDYVKNGPGDNADCRVTAVQVEMTYVSSAVYWVGNLGGSCDLTFDDGDCWSATSGGAPSGVAPTATSVVTYNDGGGSCANCSDNSTIDTNQTIQSIIIIATYGGIITQNSGITFTVNDEYSQAGGTFTGGDEKIDIAGNFTMTGGSFTSTAGTLEVTGIFNNTGGTFLPNNGQVTYNNPTDATFTNDDSFYNLLFSASSTYTLGAALDVDDNLILTDGTLDVSGSSFSVTVGGTWNNTGADFVPRSGTVTFDGAETNNQIIPNFQSFTNVSVTGTGIWTLAESLDINGRYLQTAGTVDVNSSGNYIVYAQDFDQTGGSFLSRSGTLVIDGTGDQTIEVSSTLYDLQITTTAVSTAVYTINDSIDVGHDLYILTGTLDLGPYTINVGRDFNNLSGTNTALNGGTGTISLNGGAITQTVRGSTIFNSFKVITTVAKTIEFQANSEQIITGALTLHGAAGNLLGLEPTTASTSWYLTINGGQSIEYVRPVWSNANGGNQADASDGTSVDGGNNQNWIFAATGPLRGAVMIISYLDKPTHAVFDLIQHVGRKMR